MKQLLLSLVLLTTTAGLGQGGVLPFTGIIYTENGLRAEAITAELDEYTWTSNRLPINTEFTVELDKPSGLTPEDGIYYPGIEVLLTTPKGDTLGYAADIFGEEGFPGMEEEGLDHLTLRLSFGEEARPGDTCMMAARFFDKKSANELRVLMLICIVDSELPPDNTSSTFSLSSGAYQAMSTGDIKLSSFTVMTDNETHHRLDMLKLNALAEGITAEEWAAGTVSCWYYGTNGMIPLTQKHAFVTVSEQDGQLAIAATIWSAMPRTIRIRWESPDGTKVLELLTR